MQRIVVFGANGKVGSLVVEGLLERGHHVTAFVHSAKGIVETDRLQVIEGDVHDAAVVERALAGHDAVISALGSWGTPSKDILRSGMHSIIPAMQKHGIKRIISLTGSEARAEGDRYSFIHRLAHIGAAVLAGKILVDGEVHIKQLEASKLDWTVIRSPLMNKNGSTHYQLGAKRPQPWKTINRRAVTEAMIHQLNDTHFLRSAPFITR